jgi:uncharacterized cofD-like protein
VAVGGGHGLSASLRAVRRYAGSITAVVSVADDGGSSGRLRRELPDLPAPGDVRKCLGALAEEGAPFGRILEHRFGEGELEGHTLGNLLLVALSVETGSFGAAVDEVATRVGAVGRVLPATVEPVELVGEVGGAGGDEPGAVEVVVGQVAVHNASPVRRVRLRPEHPGSPPEVGEAIAAADQVVLGPGSLFTSVLAAAVVPAVAEALDDTAARRVYVANLAPQVPETEGFTVADEVAALADHGIEVDVVVCHPSRSGGAEDLPTGVELVVAEVADEGGRVHDPARLADVLRGLAAAR